MLLCNRCAYILSFRGSQFSRNLFCRRIFTKRRQMDDKWMQCGRYQIYVWSIAGMETNVVVKADDLTVAFDMGYSSRESIKSKNVFISHGHMDHIASVPQHAAKRNLYGMKKANYYVPDHLVDTLKSVAQGYRTIDETTEVLDQLNILPLSIGEKAELPSGYFVQAFPTVHRIPSQGYIVYKNSRKLKEEYAGLPGQEVSAMFKDGVQIHEVTTTPEIAYLGDTTFEVFESPPTPDLLKVKVLITETTYIDDDKDSIAQARKRGHTHFSEICENAELFEKVDNIIMMHLSDRHSVDYIKDQIPARLPPSLKNKVQVSTLAKQRTQ